MAKAALALPLPQVCVLVFVGEGNHRNEVLSVDWKAGDEDMLASAGMDDYIMIWCAVVWVGGMGDAS